MIFLSLDRQKLVGDLQFALPLKARARPPLIERLRKTISRDVARLNLSVMDVFDAGESLGLKCQLDLTQYCPPAPQLVEPLAHLALESKYGLDRNSQRHQRRVASHPLGRR